jgi:hypothetical protein
MGTLVYLASRGDETMKRTLTTPKPGKEQLLTAGKLTAPEIRFAVANYYDAQDARKRSDMQLRHLGDKPLNSLLTFAANANAEIENTVKRTLRAVAEAHPVGRWMMAQVGIGEIIAAGLLAHIDINQAPTVGHIWAFAGLLPKDVRPWNKGEKRPYNAALKQICYHLGECVKRTHNHPDSVYGAIYRERKAYLVAKNERGGFAERAKTFVTRSADVKKTLAEGKLPAGNLDRQACNYAAKIFLSHFHALLYWHTFGKAPPKPFAITQLGHAHEIKVPDMALFPGFAEAYYGAAVRDAA